MSLDWPMIEAWAREKLSSAHEQNTQVGLSEAETNAIRGKISLIKELLRLPETKKLRDAPVLNGEPED